MWASCGLALLPSPREPQAALPWQRRDVGERSLVPAPYPPFPSHFPLPCCALHLAPASSEPCLAVLSPRALHPPAPDRGPWQSLGSTWSLLTSAYCQQPLHWCPHVSGLSCCSGPLVGNPLHGAQPWSAPGWPWQGRAR